MNSLPGPAEGQKTPAAESELAVASRNLSWSNGRLSLSGIITPQAIQPPTDGYLSPRICAACSLTFICRGLKISVMTPSSSATKVVRKVPMVVLPYIFFSP